MSTHAPFDDVVVCTPSVRSRADVLALTLAEWQRFGVEPLVHRQPDDWPLTDVSARRNAEATLRVALATAPAARYMLFAEDDILLAPELEQWMHALKTLQAPATLYLNGRLHYPRRWHRQFDGRQPAPEGILRVRLLAGWYGTLAVLLPRWVAEAVLCWSSDWYGWDIHLREFLRRHGLPLYAVNPNPVQHRGVPTTHRPDAGTERSSTFGLPDDRRGISPPTGINWLDYGGWDADPTVLYARLAAPECHFLSASPGSGQLSEEQQ